MIFYFLGSCHEDDKKTLQKKLRKPQGLKGGSGGIKGGGVRPKVLSGGRDTPDFSINEEDIEVRMASIRIFMCEIFVLLLFLLSIFLASFFCKQLD